MKFKKQIHDIVKKIHQQRFQPYDQTWHSRNKLNEQWTIEISSFFQKIQCCVICGIVKLTNKRKYYKTLLTNTKMFIINIILTRTPYAIVNVIMANYTLFDDIMHISIKCHSNLNKPQNCNLCNIQHHHTWEHYFPHIHFMFNHYHFLTLECSCNQENGNLPQGKLQKQDF